MTSEAFKALPDYAVRVLLALTSFNRTTIHTDEQKKKPGNNGDLSLPFKVAKEFGIRPSWRLGAGLSLLCKVGLIEKTRQGMAAAGATVPSLYALSWLPIAPSDKYDFPRVLPKPESNEWTNWKRPDDWAEVERRTRYLMQGKKKVFINPGGSDQSTRVDSRAPDLETRVDRKLANLANPHQPGWIPSRNRVGTAEQRNAPEHAAPTVSDPNPSPNSRAVAPNLTKPEFGAPRIMPASWPATKVEAK